MKNHKKRLGKRILLPGVGRSTFLYHKMYFGNRFLWFGEITCGQISVFLVLCYAEEAVAEGSFEKTKLVLEKRLKV